MADVPIEPGASLILAHRLQGKVVLIVGTNRLAAARLVAVANAGAWPVVIPPQPNVGGPAMDEIHRRYKRGQCALLPSLSSLPPALAASRWGALLDALDTTPLPSGTTSLNGETYVDQILGDLASDPLRSKRNDSCTPHLFGICVTDTLASTSASASGQGKGTQYALHVRKDVAQPLVQICRRRRIVINVADVPDWCDFTLPATHRFVSETQGTAGKPTTVHASSLQLAITANGQGCRVAGRIRREIVAALPRNVAKAVENIAHLRRLAQQSDGSSGACSQDPACAHESAPHAAALEPDVTPKSTPLAQGQEPSLPPGCPCSAGSRKGGVHDRATDTGDDEIFDDPTPINAAVPQLFGQRENPHRHLCSARRDELWQSDDDERTRRRMRWVAQMSEYWPLEYVATLDRRQLDQLLEEYETTPASSETTALVAGPTAAPSTTAAEGDQPVDAFASGSQHGLQLAHPALSPKWGQVYLVGSGPGHPGLLTALARDLLTSPGTDVILSDKLVPSAVLALIPAQTKLIIARKFPGNAEGAQAELLNLAWEYAQQGKTVVRLKQGDPFVYGRGGEEVLFLRQKGLEATVIPGVSSALAGPLALGIPVTQRGAADSMVLATGVGRGGKATLLPGYQRGRSLVLLMGVARLEALVSTLLAPTADTREGAAYPAHVPCAVVERASSPDQRLIAAPLHRIVEALEQVGNQRPPGMIMIGWAVLSLEGEGDTTVLDLGQDTWEQDEVRIQRWLKGRAYITREGLDPALQAHCVSSLAGPGAVPPTMDVTATRGAPGERDPHGWMPGRYGPQGTVIGGWTKGEEPVVSPLNQVQSSLPSSEVDSSGPPVSSS